ncbi:hypothetical protein A3Q56_03105 [Intoshia linei]|uniref:Uncharacterized protein n=1 Tax=Intoshia linei TaxID=1819745 RepID=A0A177B4L6_9BILA|nr:hypothetical protein A3Q56_03105 [Intoshia linei]
MNINLEHLNEVVLCSSESMDIDCQNTSSNKVISIKTALFGRMRLGRCARENLGYIGCYANVTNYYHTACSGKNKCSISLPNKKLESYSKCHKEIKSYLELSFICKKVYPELTNNCYTDCTASFVIKEKQADISNYAIRQTGCGLINCPILIKPPIGTYIELQLKHFYRPFTYFVDFKSIQNLKKPKTQIPSIQNDYNSCIHLLNFFDNVKDYLKNQNQNIQMTKQIHVFSCGHQISKNYISSILHIDTSEFVLIKNTYNSKGNSIMMYQVDYFQIISENFTLSYISRGCNIPSDLNLENYEIIRRRHNLLIKCRNENNLNILCEGEKFTGNLPPCMLHSKDVSKRSLPINILITIILSIALVISSLILTIGIVFYKRRLLYKNQYLKENLKFRNKIDTCKLCDKQYKCGYNLCAINCRYVSDKYIVSKENRLNNKEKTSFSCCILDKPQVTVSEHEYEEPRYCDVD